MEQVLTLGKHVSRFLDRLAAGLLTRGKQLSKLLDGIGAVALTGMMALTVVDVMMRYLGRPFMGAYELVSMAGAIAIGFSIPQTTLDNGNVRVDLLTDDAPARVQKALFAATRLLGIALFALLGYALVVKAIELYKAREVSLTLRVPTYPVCFGLGVCSFAEAFVLVASFFNALFQGGGNE